MSPHHRPPGAPDPAPDDELTARITGALHRRAASAPDPAVVAARLASEVARRSSPRAVALRRGGHVLAAGVVTGTFAVAAAGAAAATNPYSQVAVAVEDAARTVGLDVSFLPNGLTRDQYDAVFAAGYDSPDIEALGELWSTDYMDTKARVGQMLLDGVEVPVAPGSVRYVPNVPGKPEFNAFFAGGYTYEDAEALGALWGIESYEAKERAGAALIEGEALPLPPSEAPVATPPTAAPRTGPTTGG